jgi:GTP-binding protein HflX
LQMEGIAATLPVVRLSALKGKGIDDLLRSIREKLLLQFVALEVLIPYNRGELVAEFHQFGLIEYECYKAAGIHLRGHMPANHSGAFAAFRHE